MTEPSSEEKPKKRRNSKRNKLKELGLPTDVRAMFDQAVKEAAGKPLSMAPGSPLGKLIGTFVEHCLKEEISEHLGYQPHERTTPEVSNDAEEVSARRPNTRNGYTSKQLKTSMGSSEIQVPRDRTGSFTPQLLPKREAMSAEIEGRIIHMYSHGMTTRDIAQHVSELYHFDASKDFVSRVVERLDPVLTAWRNRPLEHTYAIVYIDAVHLKIRHANGVQSTAAYIISGYAESGRHEVLGVWIAPSEHSPGHGESASFWASVLMDVRNRGVGQILMACSDGLTGLPEAIASVYPTAKHMPCVVHQVRSSLSKTNWKERNAMAGALKNIYAAATYQMAELALDELRQRYHLRLPHVVEQWQQLLPRLADLWRYSPDLRRMVYTTNPLENINRQVRKMTKTRGAMPNIDSALRLLTLVLHDIDRKSVEKPNRRPDWSRIVQELQIHFPGMLPDDWGLR